MSDYIEDENDDFNDPVETSDTKKKKPKHTYKEINCGGSCGNCVALIVDGEIVSGPPFHLNCKCSLSEEDIDEAPEHESNLENPVAPDRKSSPGDVKWLKNALNKLGFYEPDTRAGEAADDLNEYPNKNLFDAINNFQRKHKLPERGIVKPGYQTEAKINNELQQQTNIADKPATFDKPVNSDLGYYAVFNGKKFTLYVNNKAAISWDAVSGQKGYQSPEYQNEKSKGPIPEGTYVARKEQLQYITPYGLITGIANVGTWPGSLYSWGNSRIRLEASQETNTYNRDGFHIHGGWEPGSNGCIDLTENMDDFVKLFNFIGQDLIVYVLYNR